jgi:hypothetical protein
MLKNFTEIFPDSETIIIHSELFSKTFYLQNWYIINNKVEYFTLLT